MDSGKPDFQEVIDRFAEYDVETLRARLAGIKTFLDEKQEKIDALDKKIKKHRKVIKECEDEQKRLSDHAFPYSLIQLAIDEAIKQKERGAS